MLKKIIIVAILYLTLPCMAMNFDDYTIHVNPNKKTKLINIKQAKKLYPSFNFKNKNNPFIRMIPIYVITPSNDGTTMHTPNPDECFNFYVPYNFLLEKEWNIKSILLKTGKNIEDKSLLRYEYRHKNKLLQEIADKINLEDIVLEMQEENQSFLSRLQIKLLQEEKTELENNLKNLNNEFFKLQKSLQNLEKQKFNEITEQSQYYEKKLKEQNATINSLLNKKTKLSQNQLPNQSLTQVIDTKSSEKKITLTNGLIIVLLASWSIFFIYFLSIHYMYA